MVSALVLVVIFFAIATGGNSLMPGSINNLISQNGYVFVLAAGMLLCILTGGNIDLSVGSVVCFAAAVGCVLMANKVNMWIAVLAMLGIGLAIGIFQGFWIAKVHVPAFIATLSGMYAFRGFSNVYSKSSLEFFQNLLRTPYIAGCSKANRNRVLAFWSHGEECVEGNYTVNAAYRNVEFLSDNGLNFHRKVADSMLGFVKYVDELTWLIAEFVADGLYLFNDCAA